MNIHFSMIMISLLLFCGLVVGSMEYVEKKCYFHFSNPATKNALGGHVSLVCLPIW